MDWTVAYLDYEKLRMLQDLEREMGVVLIAYEECGDEDCFDPDDSDALMTNWTERVNWEASKRDRP